MSFVKKFLRPALVLTLMTSAVSFGTNLSPNDREGGDKKLELPFGLRSSIYLQPRVEYGDLAFGENDAVESGELDIYFRRASIGFYGELPSRNLRYGAIISGDETPQNKITPTYSDEPASFTGYVQYKVSEALSVSFEKGKLPYSRVYLVSSSRQLFTERPYYLATWQEVLKTYSRTNFTVSGDPTASLRYMFSLSKDWRPGDKLYNDEHSLVRGAAPEYSARAEWSPFNLKEIQTSDAHLGMGKHVTFGVFGNVQDDLVYVDDFNTTRTERRSIYGADLSMHIRNFSFSVEGNGWNIDSTLINRQRSAVGYVIHTGMFIPHLQIEPTIRYESFDANTSAEDALVERATFGINRYFDGHKLKFMLNYEYTRFGAEAELLKPTATGKSRVLRSTLQMIF